MKTPFLLLVLGALTALADDYVGLFPHSTRESDAAARVEAVAPIVDEHPTNVPPGGMFYRLAETNGLTTLWFARTGDLLATQLSAHDTNGDEIVRTMDLRTGVERSINIRALPRAKKFQDMAAAENVRTNRPHRKPNP